MELFINGHFQWELSERGGEASIKETESGGFLVWCLFPSIPSVLQRACFSGSLAHSLALLAEVLTED
jgi:hypothetical protein